MSISTTESLASSRALSDSIQYVTEAQWEEATERHVDAYDSDDLTDVVYDHHGAILAALNAGNLQKVGEIFASARAETIARRVSIELTGRAE